MTITSEQIRLQQAIARFEAVAMAHQPWTPLDALRSGNTVFGWQLADGIRSEARIVWHLLLAWELSTPTGIYDHERLEDAYATLAMVHELEIQFSARDDSIVVLRAAAFLMAQLEDRLGGALERLKQHLLRSPYAAIEYCRALLTCRHLDTARRTARAISDPLARAGALLDVQDSLRAQGRHGDADELLVEAEHAADHGTGEYRDCLLVLVARAYAEAGRGDAARRLIAPWPKERDCVDSLLACDLARRGERDEALRAARSLPAAHRVKPLIEVAQHDVANCNAEYARSVLREALVTAEGVDAVAVASVAQGYAQLGDERAARTLFFAAARQAQRSATHWFHLDIDLILIAGSAVDAGLADVAYAIVELASDSEGYADIDGHVDESSRAGLRDAVRWHAAVVLAHAADWASVSDRDVSDHPSLRLAADIRGLWRRGSALVDIAMEQARAGNARAARTTIGEALLLTSSALIDRNSLR